MSGFYRPVATGKNAQGSPSLSYEVAILIADHLNDMIAIRMVARLAQAGEVLHVA